MNITLNSWWYIPNEKKTFVVTDNGCAGSDIILILPLYSDLRETKSKATMLDRINKKTILPLDSNGNIPK
ncbi:MAG: hypothetical protein V4538_01635 [Bacteroidota bacterium]